MIKIHSIHEQCNQDDYRFESKFLFQSLLDNFSQPEIDKILNLVLRKEQKFSELSDKFRRKIQNSRRDNISFQIYPAQFLVMIYLSSLVWPGLKFQQSGLIFSRIHDEGNYTFFNTILLPHSINSAYARARENYDKDPNHMIFVTAVSRLHRFLLWQQRSVFIDKRELIIPDQIKIEIDYILSEIC
jgi:hypothetical protein